MSAPIHTLIFYGEGESEAATALRQSIINSGRKARTRDAITYQGDAEDGVDCILLMPGVKDHHALRIKSNYAGVAAVERYNNGMEPPRNQIPQDTQKVDERQLKEARAQDDQLRRLTTRELRDVAIGRGVDVTKCRDRAAMLDAIQAAMSA